MKEIENLRKIDCHVHFVGGGKATSGSWFQLRTAWDRMQARMMLRACGISTDAMYDDLDSIYRDKLLSLVRDSSLDAVVLLAQDLAHDDNGVAMPEKSKYYVPNEVVIDIAGQQILIRRLQVGFFQIGYARHRAVSIDLLRD